MYGYNIFHDDLMNTLIGNIRQGKCANAYIFEGERGLAKHEAARLFAQALVCDDEKHAPCCECRSCVEAKAGTNPDIIFLKKEKDKATIGVEPIRAMLTDAQNKPFYARRKVYIIEDGDIVTPQAQNAFLKMFEEPPEYLVFIIVCEHGESQLETIRSRAVKVRFPCVSDDTVRRYIEEKYPDEPRLDFLVKYCVGIPYAADEIIAREDFELMRDEVLTLVPKLLSKNKLHAFAAADYFDKHKEDAAQMYDMILIYLRDAMVTAMGSPENVVNSDKKDKINILASSYTPQKLSAAMDEIIFAKKMLEKHIKASATALHAGLKII